MSTRSLQEYERERDPEKEDATCVSSKMAAKMAEVYNMQILGLWHLKYFDPCGKFMPDVIEPTTCGDMGFLVHLSNDGAQKALDVVSRLLQDGKITPDEHTDVRELSRLLNTVSGRCLSSVAYLDTQYPETSEQTN